jgi:hypothetical protein
MRSNTVRIKRWALMAWMAAGSSLVQAVMPLQPPTIVRHAGGSIDGLTYTNSIKAIERSISKGSFLIEIDLLPTRDGEWHCFHDYREMWPSDSGRARFDRPLQLWFAKMPRWTYPGALAYPTQQKLEQQIQAVPSARAPAHCTLSSLVAIAARHPKARFITDTKYDNYALLERLRAINIDAFVPQVYNIDEFRHAKALGLKQLVYTLYKRGNFQPLAGILGDSALWKIVFPAPWLCMDSPRPPPLWLNDFKGELLVHTINSIAELCTSPIRIDGYYSDHLFQTIVIPNK